jgi:hypothetical protein
MSRAPLLLAIVFGLVLLATLPDSCQRERAIHRLAREQAAALQDGRLATAQALNEQIQLLTDGTSEPIDEP